VDAFDQHVGGGKENGRRRKQKRRGIVSDSDRRSSRVAGRGLPGPVDQSEFTKVGYFHGNDRHKDTKALSFFEAGMSFVS
jgi:hypothetical protein